MEVLRELVFWLLVFIGAVPLLGNWCTIVHLFCARPKGGVSFIPLVGGILTALAFVVAPSDTLNGIWWIPLFADIACVPMLTLMVVSELWRKFMKNDNHPPIP